MTREPDKMLDIDEAVELIMQRTGKTRRQARFALVEMARSGRLKAVGINTDTNEVEEIPAECWPAIQ